MIGIGDRWVEEYIGRRERNIPKSVGRLLLPEIYIRDNNYEITGKITVKPAQSRSAQSCEQRPYNY